MKPDKSISSPLEEGLRLMSQCPVCKGACHPNQDNILKENKGVHLVHITCPKCANSIMAVVLATSAGLSSVGMLTDLNASDLLRLHDREPISEDELLSFHKLLKNNTLIIKN